MSQMEERKSSSNFFNGVVFGGLLMGAGLYLFGTEKGRENVRKMLDVFENLDEIVENKEKEFKSKKKGDSSVVSDVDNLITKLQAVLPLKEKSS